MKSIFCDIAVITIFNKVLTRAQPVGVVLRKYRWWNSAIRNDLCIKNWLFYVGKGFLLIHTAFLIIRQIWARSKGLSWVVNLSRSSLACLQYFSRCLRNCYILKQSLRYSDYQDARDKGCTLWAAKGSTWLVVEQFGCLS